MENDNFNFAHRLGRYVAKMRGQLQEDQGQFGMRFGLTGAYISRVEAGKASHLAMPLIKFLFEEDVPPEGIEIRYSPVTNREVYDLVNKVYKLLK